MTRQDLLSISADGLVPQAEAARQAVSSLRGYAYQVTAAALAWLDVESTSKIFLEVAEDYAVVAKDAISAVQVKDTDASGRVTLNTESVREAVLNFVKLTAANPGVEVSLRYFTTAEVGTEKAVQDRLGGYPGLIYWRRAARGADVQPLRALLDSDKFDDEVRQFVANKTDEELRRDLLRRIHWDCGRPDLSSLQKEFRDRFTVLARDLFGIAAPDALKISGLLVHHVLAKSIIELPADRVLTRADLLSFVDNAARVSVPISMLDVLAKASSGLMAQILGSSDGGLPVAVGLPPWLVDGADLPANKRAVPRPEVEADIEARLRTSGLCFVAGASGVGKSSVSRAVAQRAGGGYFVVDFRGADTDETRNRLDSLLARLGNLRTALIVLEDLNQFNDPALAATSARLFEALTRRDIAAVVTCYGPPTPKALSNIGQDPKSSFDCPYFSEDEAASLVALHGGDPAIWGKLAYISGAFGHPQLVHAFVAGIAARGWPQSEIPTIVGAGLSTGDIAAEREAARRSLLSVLPENARALLYRLSLTIGTFDRRAALSIATAPPPISQAGESLDALIGPWIETMGRDSYRVSPLASRSGQEMLVQEEQHAIHFTIASQLLSGRTIDAGEIEKILLHAILGKNEVALVSLASKLVTSADEVIAFLAENSALLRVLDTDRLIYPTNPYVSLMLRLVQFNVLAARRDATGIEKCVRALLREGSELQATDPREMSQVLSLGKILGTLGIANYLDDWVDLLVRFQTLASENPISKELLSNLEKQPEVRAAALGVLFAIGASNLSSVAKLEHIFEKLDKLEPGWRSMMFELFLEATPDFAVLVNSPWVAEQHNGLDALDAAERYRRMAAITASWEYRPLTIQCWIARAVMLDEYANDSAGALSVLDEAVSEYGDDVLLSRARAKVHWRAQEHQMALSILRGIADEIGKNNSVERAFALREAAISAAHCADWPQAELWLQEAKISALESTLPDMQAMAVGLGADAAVAAFESGSLAKCLTGLADALDALSGIDAGESLRGAHCHHLIRHTVLWLQSRLEGSVVMLGGEPIAMRPGICSNPEPVDGIADRPLGSVDIAWYMLAAAEVIGRTNAGIAGLLAKRVKGGPIALLEANLRTKRLEVDIEDTDAGGFARHLLSYVEGLAYIATQHGAIARDFDAFNPKRELIPQLKAAAAASVYGAQMEDAVLAFAISCACRRVPENLVALSDALQEVFGADAVAPGLFSRVPGGQEKPAPGSFEDVLVDGVLAFGADSYVTPRQYCLAAVRFLQQAQRSNFRACLVRMIAAWQRASWTRIVESEAFRLSRPGRAVPALRAALARPVDDETFVCRLFLAATAATDIGLPDELRANFERLAARAEETEA